MIGFRRNGPSPAAPVGLNAGQLTPCHRAAPSSATRPSQGDERDAQRPPLCPRFWTLALECKPGSRAPILGLRKSILGWSLAFDLECWISLSLFETERLGQQVKSDRARSKRAAPASMLARVAVRRGAECVPPRAVAAWPSLRSLDAGCAGFYASARHGVARGDTCVASGGGGLAVAALARRGLCAGYYAGARHVVARGGTCAASGGGGLAVAALARRGMRRLLRWRASRCGARWHMCCLRRRRLGRCCSRSARDAPASTLARVTVWREAARVPSQAVSAWPLLRSFGAGCAGFYAGARHGVARGGDGLAVAALARRGLRRLLRWRASRCGARRHVCCLRWRRLGRCCARSARAAPASTLARATVWREAALVPPRAVTASPLLHSLGAGCADFYAGARHGVARGSTCAASGGGGLAVAALARRRTPRVPPHGRHRKRRVDREGVARDGPLHAKRQSAPSRPRRVRRGAVRLHE